MFEHSNVTLFLILLNQMKLRSTKPHFIMYQLNFMSKDHQHKLTLTAQDHQTGTAPKHPLQWPYPNIIVNLLAALSTVMK